MTPQESQMLNDLATKISQTQLQEKDPEAEQLLQRALGHDQDAIYKLAQTVLVQNIALDQARQQILHLQQPPAPARATSFLGSLLGRHDPAPPPPPSAQNQYQQVPPQYVQPGYAAAQPQYAPTPASGGSSFLRSAATTAAGVAAGALAFEGVESLLHMGGGGFEAPREEIINNYYGAPEGGGYQDQGYDVSGVDEQPQGGYDVSGADEQPQGDDSYDSDFGGGDDSSFV